MKRTLSVVGTAILMSMMALKALSGVVGKSLKYAKLIAAEGGDGLCPKTWQTA